MPNSTDKPSEEEQQKDSGQAVGGADAHEPSEQSLRKRDRQSTPHSSPPRFVSVEELMETAKGVTNLALAHEIVVNGSFQVKPTQPAEGSLQKRVKDIMHRAFWDCLEAQLKEDPPMYDHAIKLLGEIKETLLSFLLPGHRRLRNQIEEGLDLALIQQQAEKGTLDINNVAEFIIGMMGMLCAPSRDEEIQKLRAITGIVPLFRAIFQVLDLMKIDMANFAVSSIRPHLVQQSVEYERKKFQEFLDKQPNALDFTQNWLQDTAKVLLNCRWEEQGPGVEAAAPRASMLPPLSLHNHAYLRLLKWDHAAAPFPETLLMDQSRFQEMQLELEQLGVTAAVLLVVYNSAGAALTGLPDLMRRLKSAALVLLAAMHSPSFEAEEVFSTIAEKMCAEVASCLVQHSFSPLSPDGQRALKGQITAVRCPDNSIRKLIDSRIHTFLLGFLESSSQRSIPPLPGGLAPIQKELEGIAVKLSRLVNYNKLVFAPYYQKILQDVLEEAARTGTSIG
ncbi:T-complex protein 11-like protein 1 [Paramormyrops kingsleyae]|uniref:T-complex 11, testis-specific-like 1 n=1 Tax=Paramormyrops kingsleyae TaxID=1676925 RepID=A0A3B3QR85_9TELE|nr:T-complex protein 11-like protein 1 [Paramormyrops kingsleyae]